jgi:hypothetical protein
MASDRWDDLLSDSTWYVPAANLLAYRLESTTPEAPIPAADQTIWSIGHAEGGRFTGKSLAKIVDASGDVTQSLTTMDGVVTEGGQVRITFTTPIGSTITGIGQVQRVNGAQAMQMQMITGGNGSYTTHWAYMLPVTSGTTPPDPATDPGDQAAYRSGSHRWLMGTRWDFQSPGPSRHQIRGRFTINAYHNGYFWGEGRERGNNKTFKVLGSITPEGNFFLNAIDTSDFKLRLSESGQLWGPRRQAQAMLRPYTNTPGQFGLPLKLRRIDVSKARDVITEGGEPLPIASRYGAGRATLEAATRNGKDLITQGGEPPGIASRYGVAASRIEMAARLEWPGGGGLVGADYGRNGGDGFLAPMGVFSDRGASWLRGSIHPLQQTP